MKKTAILFIICLISSRAVAQANYTLTGRILDDISGKAIANVNVYLSNSLLGTVTNDSGYYIITGIHDGTYEAVASFMGYESMSQVVTFDEIKNLKKDFRLKQKTYILNDVNITAANANDWRQNYALFCELFLGKSDFAKECEIENKEQIDLKWESFDVLTAKCSVPLIIVNNALGYRINCVLEQFRWDKANKMVNYVVKPGFSLLEPQEATDTLKWKQNRLRAYEFSIERFLGSLISDNYYEKGYKIFLDPQPAAENYVSMYSERVTGRELVLKKSSTKAEEYALHFKNFLRVEYNHETTWLRLLYPEISMDRNGNVKELVPFQVTGAWSTIGIANMLPQYFNAE
ncbi:MAG: carboxypeptidase-like regulatory domain-containing protein [Ignavibacteria bacterium]|jgi:hypothetical protein|nr:carboxypeptidase-like regulatory domain-containing protein [Ignavibacteria bacterium]MCU7501584.1 carboxypeptidase-like regulatory domain-containing protein [Ignavibacteria bacterium]MCU7517121.1 carboxypeptidase-like regulatory domain-containing protein [Ignavibacteria bacterium]